MQDHGVVGRQGPRRGGPDGHVELALPGLEARGHGGHLKAHEDGGADLVGVLNLGLGKGGVAVAAPVHRLAAAVDGALVEDLLEDLDIGRVVVVRVGQVGVVPLAQHAQALEALALRVHLLDGHLAAQLANLLGGKLAEAGGAHHVLDLVLDGQAVAVPAGHVRREVAAHGPVAIDDVLADLVLRVAQMDGAVGVRGAVMQHELVMPLVLAEELLVHALLVPCCQATRLVGAQVCAHGEPGLGQVHGCLVLVCHLLFPSLVDAPRNEAPVPSCWDEAPHMPRVRSTPRSCDPACGYPHDSAGRSRRPLRRRLLGSTTPVGAAAQG